MAQKNRNITYYNDESENRKSTRATHQDKRQKMQINYRWSTFRPGEDTWSNIGGGISIF